MAMTPPPEIYDLLRPVVAAILAVTGYLLFRQRLMVLATRERGRAAYLGEALLAAGRLPERHAVSVRFALDHLFNGWLPWVYVLIAPTYVVGVVCRLIDAPDRIVPEKVDIWYAAFARSWWVALMAQSPLAALLLLIEAPFLFVLWSFAPDSPLLSGLASRVASTRLPWPPRGAH